MATKKAAFMETDHPIVRKIWEMLEKGIPPQYLDATNLVPPGMIQKSVTQAAELRTLGDASYDSRNFDEATLYYSKSVAIAPADTEELGLAYCNRSAVFFYREQYEPCLLDVNRALAGPLPPGARDIMLQRKTIAWRLLQEQNRVRTGMREGILYMKRYCRQEATLTAYERRVCYVSKMGVDDVDLVIDHSDLDDPIWNTKFDRTSLGNVSPKIELKYDAQWGPHLVAKDDIEPGEPLCFEDMYSCFISEHLKFDYCNYCHFRCEALIPCTNCTVEMYCSTGCREKAYDSYHRVECQILPLWVDATNEFQKELRVLCLRTFLRITKQGSELANLMNNSVVCKALDGTLNCANVQFSPENFPLLANVVSRLRCSNVEEEICGSVILRETIAIFASLRSVQFFSKEDGRSQCSGYSSRELEYSAIMHLVYQMSLTWSHSFYVKYYLVYAPEAPMRGRLRYIGRGFSLLQCFTHHSCDPNIGTVTNKRHMLTYSLRSVKAGEPIRPARFANYTVYSREERRYLYKLLWFPSQCLCKACVEDWPNLGALISKWNTYRIRDEATLRRIQTIVKTLCEDNFREEDLKTVIEFSKTIREYVAEPSFIIYMCEYNIESVMLSKGNLRVWGPNNSISFV